MQPFDIAQRAGQSTTVTNTAFEIGSPVYGKPANIDG